MKKQCQSCGMPLYSEKDGDRRGTEYVGNKSEKWCSLCYQNGDFVIKDCTLNQMTDIVDKALMRTGSSSTMRWIAKKQLPRLERWR